MGAKTLARNLGISPEEARRILQMMKERYPVLHEWLDRVLPNSRGIRRLEDGKLFFPEEMPDIIADEAKRLWRV